MGGLWSVFKKVVPIITLVCFICLGITHTFQQVGADNITYLSTETYDKETWEKIENPTPQEQQEGFTYYTFDTNTYMSNFNVNYLKDASTNVSNLDAFLNTLNKFNEIWEDGYQFLDGVKTIINGLLLIFNGLLTCVNMVLWPVRLLSALILTAFNLVGINTANQIANNGIICSTLYFFCYQLAIPLINPTTNIDGNTRINQTHWLLNNSLTLNSSIWSNRKNFYFESNGQEFSSMNDYSNKLYYNYYTQGSTTENQILVYENGQWVNQAYRNITILDKNSLTDNEVEDIYNFLYENGDYIDNTLVNTKWQFNNSFTYSTLQEKYFYFYSYTDLGNSYYGLKVDADNTLYYINVQNSTYVYIPVYQNNTWEDSSYKTIQIVNQTMYSKTTSALKSLLTSNANQIS